jgi:hypothetical protein
MNIRKQTTGVTRREALKMGIGAMAATALGGVSGHLSANPANLKNQKEDVKKLNYRPAAAGSKVDFSYSFTTPHRVTLGRPDASDRTLFDLTPGNVQMLWTYDNLSMANYPPLTFRTPKTMWGVKLTPKIDNNPFTDSRWSRLDGFLPGLENIYENQSGSVHMKALSGLTACLVEIELTNTDMVEHQFVIYCKSMNSRSENPAWIDPDYYAGDNLQAGWSDRADRILIVGLGADAYSLRDDRFPPGSQDMIMVWKVKPGEVRRGWIVRPYKNYEPELQILRQNDWAKEMERGKEEWMKLLNQASKLVLPDQGVQNAYYACLSDLFIMREPLSDGRIIGVPGTEGYRAGNSAEPLIISVALDQNGLHRESAAASSISFDMQEPDGCWADKRGWMHAMWAASGFKSWAIMEHYRLTGDREYLSEVYPRMLASSRWQHKQRDRMRVGDKDSSVTYGLMPRGFGDAGLMNDDDMYGVFIPHNIWAVYADRCSLEAAQILGETADIDELKKIYETAWNDLKIVFDRGSIKEKEYRWIPGVPGKTSGSCWGALNTVVPCGLLPADHELVTGTLKKIEANVSIGGQPIHTGWMADGAWVAITLDNIAEIHLARGNGDAAINYLYSTLNHGTPLFTWCEERGQEPGTTKTSGDRQHLWTPVAVVRFMRDMMVMEQNDGLHLALGTAREWLGSGRSVGVSDACTHFGKISYQMQFNTQRSTIAGEINLDDGFHAAWLRLNIRLPEKLIVKTVNRESKAKVLSDGSGLKWEDPHGNIKFEISVGS